MEDQQTRRARGLRPTGAPAPAPDRAAGPPGAGAGEAEPGRGMNMDPTRKLLKVFGVKVTDYEAKTDALLERSAGAAGEARLAILEEALELTADLDHWLREVSAHVLERQERVLTRLREH